MWKRTIIFFFILISLNLVLADNYTSQIRPCNLQVYPEEIYITAHDNKGFLYIKNNDLYSIQPAIKINTTYNIKYPTALNILTKDLFEKYEIVLLDNITTTKIPIIINGFYQNQQKCYENNISLIILEDVNYKDYYKEVSFKDTIFNVLNKEIFIFDGFGMFNILTNVYISVVLWHILIIITLISILILTLIPMEKLFKILFFICIIFSSIFILNYFT